MRRTKHRCESNKQQCVLGSKLVRIAHLVSLSCPLLLFFLPSRYPPVRVGLGVYVVLMHLWFAFVFVHLMHEFGQETHDDESALNAGISMSSTPHAT